MIIYDHGLPKWAKHLQDLRPANHLGYKNQNQFLWKYISIIFNLNWIYSEVLVSDLLSFSVCRLISSVYPLITSLPCFQYSMSMESASYTLCLPLKFSPSTVMNHLKASLKVFSHRNEFIKSMSFRYRIYIM